MQRTIILALTICVLPLPAWAQMRTPTFDLLDWPSILGALGLSGIAVWLRG